MLPTLGHCEDSACVASSTHTLVRLFRCSIHCDRNLCLYHLNAHNVYYEEEKKQNDIVICELQKSLNLYQTIFDQQILAYRELVRQASTILLHNTSSLVPIDQIRPVVEKIQQAIAIFQGEKIIIKCEPISDVSDNENEKNKIGNNDASDDSTDHKVVVRIPRVDCISNDVLPENRTPTVNDVNSNNFTNKEPSCPVQSSYVARRIIERMKKKSLPLKRIQK